MRAPVLLMLAACSSSNATTDAPGGGDDAPAADASGDAAAATGLGTVGNVTATTCPQGIPAGSTCETITVTGCAEPIDATVSIVNATGTVRGTIVHFKGGGGEGLEVTGLREYTAAGFRQVFVSWKTDWEQTVSAGIKAGGCRPSTVLDWAFRDPTLHNGNRALGFCGQGFSGGSGQLGYALAHYGLADELDYVNELSGPPFARIDLGCNGDAPPSATVCGATDTMKLPNSVTSWENIQAPLTCGSRNVPAAELDRWKADSILVGGVYDYPKTRVEFFDCTNQATAVTAMAQLYFQTITSPEVAYHCYSQADGCQGEGLGTGSQAAVSAMIAGCVPRHQ